MNKHRIIVLLDMDCFYVQCEQRLQPDKWHKPCAVAQYNNWKGFKLDFFIELNFNFLFQRWWNYCR